MRFFKRRGKEKLDIEREEIGFDLWFQDRMAAVTDAAGVDEKLLKLAEIRTDIENRIEEKHTEISRSSGKKALASYVGAVAAQGGLAVGATILTGGAALPIVLLLPFGAQGIANKVGDASQKRLERGASDFINLLEERKEDVFAVENKLLEDNIEVIAKSGMRDYIFGRYPDLKTRFAEASARKLADGTAAQPADAPKRKSIFDRFPGR